MAHTAEQQRATRRARILGALSTFQRAYIALALRDLNGTRATADTLDTVPLRLIKMWTRDCVHYRLRNATLCANDPNKAARRCYFGD